jgi:hypothetical protein
MSKIRTASMRRLTAKPVAPEDIRPGQYVIITHMVFEGLPHTYLQEPPGTRPIELLRVAFMSQHCTPMRVVDVCLPVIVIKAWDGEQNVIDARRVRLARVPLRFGRDTMARLRAKPKKRDKKSSDDEDDDDD